MGEYLNLISILNADVETLYYQLMEQEENTEQSAGILLRTFEVNNADVCTLVAGVTGHTD